MKEEKKRRGRQEEKQAEIEDKNTGKNVIRTLRGRRCSHGKTREVEGR